MKRNKLLSIGVLSITLTPLLLVACSNSSSNDEVALVITEKDFGDRDLTDPYMRFDFNLAIGDGVSAEERRMWANINAHGHKRAVVRKAALIFLNSLEWTWTIKWESVPGSRAATNNLLPGWSMDLANIRSRLTLGQKLYGKVW